MKRHQGHELEFEFKLQLMDQLTDINEVTLGFFVVRLFTRIRFYTVERLQTWSNSNNSTTRKSVSNFLLERSKLGDVSSFPLAPCFYEAHKAGNREKVPPLRKSRFATGMKFSNQTIERESMKQPQDQIELDSLLSIELLLLLLLLTSHHF